MVYVLRRIDAIDQNKLFAFTSCSCSLWMCACEACERWKIGFVVQFGYNLNVVCVRAATAAPVAAVTATVCIEWHSVVLTQYLSTSTYMLVTSYFRMKIVGFSHICERESVCAHGCCSHSYRIASSKQQNLVGFSIPRAFIRY